MSTDSLRGRKGLIAVITILIIGSGVWGVTALAKNRKSALPKELSAEAIKADMENDPGKAFEKARAARDRKDLTEDQRHQIWENVHSAMEVRMDQRMNEYFAAPPEQRQVIMDRHIDEMQVRMKEWQQRREQRDRERGQTQPSGSGGAIAGGPSGSNAPGGNASNNGGDQGRGWGGRDGTPSRERRKEHSESRDPDKTARRMAYFSAMQQRAQQRGVQMPMGRGPRGG